MYSFRAESGGPKLVLVLPTGAAVVTGLLRPERELAHRANNGQRRSLVGRSSGSFLLLVDPCLVRSVPHGCHPLVGAHTLDSPQD